MQTEGKSEPSLGLNFNLSSRQPLKSQPSFSANTKNIALKILRDYARARVTLSGKKIKKWGWTRIISQIAKFHGWSTDELYFLTRQDLENWGNGGEIGDAKYRYIHAYLSDQAVAEHFAQFGIRSLLSYEVTAMRLGRYLHNFYGLNINELRNVRKIAGTVAGRNYVEQLAQEFLSGLFFGRLQASEIHNFEAFDFWLSIDRMPDESFFVVHLLSSALNSRPNSLDWNFSRSSGIAIVDVLGLRLHMKNLSTGLPEHHILVDDLAPEIFLVFDRVIQTAIHFCRGKYIADENSIFTLSMRGVEASCSKVEDAQLSEIIDNFRWEIV